MASGRPLLIPSPHTPSSPYTNAIGSDQPAPDVGPNSTTQLQNPPPVRHASSRSRSRNSESNTVSFPVELRSSLRATFAVERSGSKPAPAPAPPRFPSRRSESGRLVGSQREIADEDARFVFVNEPERTNQPIKLPNNSISTTKYNLLTFLPRNLFEQFHRVAYVYFLVLACLNQVPQLGVFSPVLSFLPLIFVLGVTAVKDAYEDWRRHRSDRSENNREASVLIDGEFRPKRWKDVRVGEVLRVKSNETLPCDMVLLATSDPTGVAYVRTTNLDGESNLKTRYAKQETLHQSPNVVSGLIKCERPNRNIYGFHANIDIDGKRVSLGPSNIILRGCELKNTDWLVGVAVYTGQDTKVMLNNSGAPFKRSRLETHMNRETILLAITLAVVCSIVTVLAGVWLGVHADELGDLPYFRKRDYSGRDVGKYNYYGLGWQIVFTFMGSVILFQVMIPIALYISMELVRIGQAFFMIQDKAMFDEASGSRFQCRALNINEDLGQIKYVFSDKTGTLTENKMEFQCASVRGTDYSGRNDEEQDEGHSILVDGQVWRPKMGVKADPELLRLVRGGKGTKKGDGARDFLLALATCNTIVPLVVETPDPALKLIDYQGESPDEQALTYAAAAYGFVLVERTSGHIVIDVLGERQRIMEKKQSSKIEK